MLTAMEMARIDDDDHYCYKSPAPDVIMGLTTKFIYKNWDFSAAFHASIGNYVILRLPE